MAKKNYSEALEVLKEAKEMVFIFSYSFYIFSVLLITLLRLKHYQIQSCAIYTYIKMLKLKLPKKSLLN